MVSGEGFSFKSAKVDEVKRKPKWLVKGHSDSDMLDINFERRVIISQTNVNCVLVMQVNIVIKKHRGMKQWKQNVMPW